MLSPFALLALSMAGSSTPFPTSFSKEAGDDNCVAMGKGKWWGKLLITNRGANRENTPFTCALGCGYTWTKSGCNATKQAGHIIGDDNAVKA